MKSDMWLDAMNIEDRVDGMDDDLLPGERIWDEEPKAFPVKASVFFQSWAGLRSVPVTVLGETPKRYRVRYERALSGNYSGDVGAIRLVPKHAVVFAAESPALVGDTTSDSTQSPACPDDSAPSARGES